MSDQNPILNEDLDINPVSVLGRSHYACLRCKSLKVKCSGQKPVCSSCLTTNRVCKYPFKDRKIIILQSQLNKLTDRIRKLENLLVNSNNYANNTHADDLGKDNHDNTTASIDVIVDDISNTVVSTHLNDLDSAIKVSFGDDVDKIENEINQNSKNIGDHSMKNYGGGQNRATDRDNGTFNCFIQDHQLVADNIFIQNSHSNSIIKLPSKSKSLKLVNLTLNAFQDSHYLYDQKTFLDKIDLIYDNLSCENSQFLAKFFITLAIGELFLYSEKSNRIDPVQFNLKYGISQPGLKFFTIAIKLFNINIEVPKLSEIQTALLIGYFNQSLNRISNSYIWFGTATRWALALNLHLKNTPSMKTGTNLLEKSKRKRVWWTVFVLDSFATSRVRLPIHVNFNQTNIELLDESDYIYWSGSKVLAAQVLLLKFTDKIINSIYYLNNNNFPQDLITNSLNIIKMLEYHFENYLQNDFHNMLNEISNCSLTSFHKSLIHVFLKYHQCILTTCRPLTLAIFKKLINFKVFEESLTIILEKCIHSALENLKILIQLVDLRLLNSFDYWHTHFCFNSILILMITFPAGENLRWYQHLKDLDPGLHLTTLSKSVELLKTIKAFNNPVAVDSINKLNLIIKLFIDSNTFPDEIQFFHDLNAGLNDLAGFDLWNNGRSSTGDMEDDSADSIDDDESEEVLINLQNYNVSSVSNSNSTVTLNSLNNSDFEEEQSRHKLASKSRKLSAANPIKQNKKNDSKGNKLIQTPPLKLSRSSISKEIANMNDMDTSSSPNETPYIKQEPFDYDFDDLEKNDILKDSNPNQSFPVFFGNSSSLPNVTNSKDTGATYQFPANNFNNLMSANFDPGFVNNEISRENLTQNQNQNQNQSQNPYQNENQGLGQAANLKQNSRDDGNKFHLLMNNIQMWDFNQPADFINSLVPQHTSMPSSPDSNENNEKSGALNQFKNIPRSSSSSSTKEINQNTQRKLSYLQSLQPNSTSMQEMNNSQRNSVSMNLMDSPSPLSSFQMSNLPATSSSSMSLSQPNPLLDDSEFHRLSVSHYMTRDNNNLINPPQAQFPFNPMQQSIPVSAPAAQMNNGQGSVPLPQYSNQLSNLNGHAGGNGAEGQFVPMMSPNYFNYMPVSQQPQANLPRNTGMTSQNDLVNNLRTPHPNVSYPPNTSFQNKNPFDPTQIEKNQQ